MLDNSPLYWSAMRCAKFLESRGVWVGGWPENIADSHDCLATIRAACSWIACGTSPEQVVKGIVCGSTLEAEVIKNPPVS